MSIGIRSDPAGGKLYFQVDSVDVANLTSTALTLPGSIIAGTREVAEYGSNSNGEYVRYYNGVQACWVKRFEPVDWASSLTQQWTFPAAFALASPGVFATVDASAVKTWVVRDMLTTSARIVLNSGADNAAPNVFAIGRWY